VLLGGTLVKINADDSSVVQDISLRTCTTDVAPHCVEARCRITATITEFALVNVLTPRKACSRVACRACSAFISGFEIGAVGEQITPSIVTIVALINVFTARASRIFDKPLRTLKDATSK
jgi:hypothetical protein